MPEEGGVGSPPIEGCHLVGARARRAGDRHSKAPVGEHPKGGWFFALLRFIR